jgi:hypothetical protein
MSIDIKAGDVFLFRYHPAKEQGWDSRKHCFEGILVAKESDSGFTLHDTYWHLDGSNGRWFKPVEAIAAGTLTYYFNLNDVSKIREYDICYYDDHEVFCMHVQNACSANCRSYYLRKGAERSKGKMLSVVAEKIEEAEHKVASATRDIKRYTEMKSKIESGDLEVYL